MGQKLKYIKEFLAPDLLFQISRMLYHVFLVKHPSESDASVAFTNNVPPNTTTSKRPKLSSADACTFSVREESY